MVFRGRGLGVGASRRFVAGGTATATKGFGTNVAYRHGQTSPKSVPNAPLVLLIPASYNPQPRCNGNNGNNTNCDALTNTQPRLTAMPKASMLKHRVQVLRGLSDIGRACKVAKPGYGGGAGGGLSRPHLGPITLSSLGSRLT